MFNPLVESHINTLELRGELQKVINVIKYCQTQQDPTSVTPRDLLTEGIFTGEDYLESMGVKPVPQDPLPSPTLQAVLVATTTTHGVLTPTAWMRKNVKGRDEMDAHGRELADRYFADIKRASPTQAERDKFSNAKGELKKTDWYKKLPRTNTKSMLKVSVGQPLKTRPELLKWLRQEKIQEKIQYHLVTSYNEGDLFTRTEAKRRLEGNPATCKHMTNFNIALQNFESKGYICKVQEDPMTFMMMI